MKFAYIILASIGTILLMISYVLSAFFNNNSSKIKDIIAATLLVVGFVAIIVGGILKCYMWWTTLGW